MIFPLTYFAELNQLEYERPVCRVCVYNNIHLYVMVFDVECYEIELLLQKDHKHLGSP